MAAVHEPHFRFRVVTAEGLRPGREEERIIAAPHGKGGRPVLAKPCLDGRVQRDVALIVQQQVELDLVVARAVQQRLVQGVSFGFHHSRIGDAGGVPEQGRAGGEIPATAARFSSVGACQ